MRGLLSNTGPFARLIGWWHSLDRGWQATTLGVVLVSALSVVGP
ncbi:MULTISPECIES: hypothetical protein [Haloferax]|nr:MULTISPECIES: hypothetical protein [Haloferax]